MVNILDINNFNGWLKVKNLSDKTIHEYNYWLSKFNVSELSQQYILEFLSNNNNPVCRASVVSLINYLRYNDQSDQTQITISRIHIPKITGRVKKAKLRYLTEDEANELSDKANTAQLSIGILLGFYAGLRLSEICGNYAITNTAFKFDTWKRNPAKPLDITILGKGKVERDLFIPSNIAAKIYQYCLMLSTNPEVIEFRLIKYGTKRFAQVFNDLAIRTYGERHNKHIHMLRHGCAMWLKSKGWTIDEVKVFLGHKNIGTTNIYFQSNIKDIKDKKESVINPVPF